MLYEDIYSWLGWPARKQTFEPEGAGARVYSEFAQSKIQRALDSGHPGVKVNVGVIAADPNSDSSEAPLALVCEFPRSVRDEVLDLVHQLAWNLSRTALLITLEPQRLIAWTCYQDPTRGDNRRVCALPTPGGFTSSGSPQQQQVRDLLHWVNLITHRAQSEQPKKFPSDGRADALLLKNLRYVRSELLRMELPQDHCHDLLARVIFTQFLFHRKDSGGHSFFSEQKMQRLHEDKVLSKAHGDLASVLSNKTDTYALFRWMDERFNGDLFPGKDNEDDADREASWRAEKNIVSKDHLRLLSDLISGDLVASDNQPLLWRHYSFDTIPLEFISSVYEEFLTAEERGNDKAYYTPSHLVDYVLDAVLPWNSEDWNVRILDPCCGSAIFLVKAFQRLIHRWRRAHPNQEPLVTDLRPILENNLVGVDKNREAVRVACFSLYLAMADAIEPKHYVTRENYKVFPRLRGTRLIHRDFFDEETKEISTTENKEKNFDYVLGNAPWGDSSILHDRLRDETDADYRNRVATLPPTPGQKWAKSHDWPVANKDIGPLFLAKAAELVKPFGLVAMVNTASLLYWRDGQAAELRRKLFTTFTFEEITNFSAIRKELFSQAIGASCAVVFRRNEKPPSPETQFHYFSPKSSRYIQQKGTTRLVNAGIIIEPDNINTLSHGEAATDPLIWPLLALSSRRDLVLLRKLNKLPNFKSLKATSKVETRLGVIPGNQQRELPKEFKKRRYLDTANFPEGTFLELNAKSIPVWDDPRVADSDSTIFDAFKTPQLLIKQSLVTKESRFQASLIVSDDPIWGVICKKTYFSVHDLDTNGSNIRKACIVYNSRLATYFLALTSSRIGHFITEALSNEIVTVPLPPGEAPVISSLRNLDAVDEATRQMFGLTTADWTLIEDFINYTLPDILRRTPGPARFSTQRKDKDQIKEPELTQYAKTFTRVLKGTFGKEKSVAATIFTEPDDRKLPVRMLTIHLDAPDREGVKIDPIEADGLLDKLAEFHNDQLTKKTRDATGSGLGFQRVAYFFHPSRENGRRVMNLTIVKPDERRYWTRTTAMRDADQLAGAIAKAGMLARSKA